MPHEPRTRSEGVFRDEAGTRDRDGFIAPSTGLVDHALYFTAAPDVLVKTRELIDAGRLGIPGAVVVWDETIGRRKGAKAVAGAWWAGPGSITMTIVLPGAGHRNASDSLRLAAAATLTAIESFSPRSPVSWNGSGLFHLAGNPVGMIQHETFKEVDIVTLRINGTTDYSRAPDSVRRGHSRLIDVIDHRMLPLGKPGTLPNALATALMSAIPQAFAQAG